MPQLTVEHIARIEGHGNVSVRVGDGQVLDVRLDVVEPERFFESMVVGRRYEEAPLIASRICGICSPNHVVTSIKGIEAALGVVPSERTVLLRKLLVYGSYLQNHATHLYVFAAPDYVGLPNVFPLASSHPEIMQRALRVKKLGNDLTTLMGGRPVHPMTPVVGGFSSEPALDDLAAMRGRLNDAVDDALATAELFTTFEEPVFRSEGDMVALSADDDYAIYEGEITSLLGGWRRDVSEYRDVVREQVVGHSNAKHSTVDGRTFMVGSLPRLDLSSAMLQPRARQALEDAGLELPSRNPFMNNIAQAVELVDAAERCIGYVDRLLSEGGSSSPSAVELRAGSGVGATEAPRGTLYHSYSLDGEGRITAADIITPTAQNLGNLESDMRAYAPTVVDKPRDEFLLLIERLVRAYDPCLSCSVH